MKSSLGARVITVSVLVSLSLAVTARAGKDRVAKSVPDGHWESVGGGITGTSVVDLVVYGTQLIAGGIFTDAGGQPVGNIAAWDGTSWSSLDGGVDGNVTALAVYDNNLIVAGGFTHSGAVATQHISAWNGSGWSALGAGRGPVPPAMTVYDGKLIVAINTTSGSMATTIAYLDTWDGSNWGSLPGVFSPPPTNPPQVFIDALGVYGGKLVVGGLLPEYYAYTWDGTAWSNIGGSLTWTWAFAEWNGDLVAASFTPGLAVWNGSTWGYPNPPGCSADGMEDILVYAGSLIAAGDFGGCTPYDAQNIAAWDGTVWSSLGTGMNGAVNTLAEFNGVLVAGGTFSQADGQPAPLIARWVNNPVAAKTTTWGGLKGLYRDKN